MMVHLNEALSFSIILPDALIKGIQACLEDIFIQNSWSDKAVANMLSENKAWGSRDRRIATNIIYNIVRKYLHFNELCKNQLNVSTDDTATQLNGLMLLGIYSTYPDKIEPSLHSIFPDIHTERFCNQPWLKYSLEPWIYETIVRDWDTSAEALITHLDQPAPVYIRRNRLKASQTGLEKALKDLGVSYHICDEMRDAYVIEGNNQLRNSKAFNAGWFEFQDIGSQWIIEKAGIPNNMTVLDFCAGKGGKTLHIASLMGNSGKLIASDNDTRRLKHLSERATRAGVKNLEILDSGLLSHQRVQADLVIVDAPCTGSGTFRRQPDLKFRLNKERLEEIIAVQREILMQASRHVKPGCKLVYATCSVFKEEDEMQTEWFLYQMKDIFHLVDQAYIIPPRYNSDGFYMAVMERVIK